MAFNLYRDKKKEDGEPENKIDDNSHIELSGIERESCKANFQFYDRGRVGYVERFELPMVLAGKYIYVDFIEIIIINHDRYILRMK